MGINAVVVMGMSKVDEEHRDIIECALTRALLDYPTMSRDDGESQSEDCEHYAELHVGSTHSQVEPDVWKMMMAGRLMELLEKARLKYGECLKVSILFHRDTLAHGPMRLTHFLLVIRRDIGVVCDVQV